MNPKYTLQGILIVLVLCILAFLVYDYFKKRSVEEEFNNFEYIDGSDEYDNEPIPADNEPLVKEEQPRVMPTEQPKAVPSVTESSPRPLPKTTQPASQYPTDCFPKDKLKPEDLLPMDAANSEWAQVNPAGQGDVKNQNYLTAGYHLGVNSIGSTLRNANMQLRSELPNPRTQVSPWLNSTIEPDLNRKPLEINGCD
jgi:hypothetical protein